MSSGIQNTQNYIFNLILSFLSYFFIPLSPLKKPTNNNKNRFRLLCALHVLWRVIEIPPEQVYTHPLVRCLLFPLILVEGFLQKLKLLWLPVKALRALEENVFLTVSPADFC